MQKFRLICGIDVSKSHLVVVFIEGEQVIFRHQFSNDASGIQALYEALLERQEDPTQTLVCLEHTGVYIEKLTLAFADTGLFVWVVNPLMIKYARVNFERIKTDPVDAEKIARFAQMLQQKAQLYQPASHQEAQIRDLYRLRKQLVKLAQQVKNFAATNLDKAIPSSIGQDIWQQLKQELSEKIKEVETQLKTICKKDPEIKRYHQILRSIPTVGPVTAWQLIYTTQAFRRFPSHKQLASYAGTAPFPFQSGSSIKRRPRTSQKACKSLKTNLTMGAVSQIRPKMVFEQYYRYMKEQKGKEHLWIINSIRNIVIKLAFDLIGKDQLFDLNTFLKNKKSWHKFLTLS